MIAPENERMKMTDQENGKKLQDWKTVENAPPENVEMKNDSP